MKNKAAVFILLGQSNAVGHGIPMEESDVIREPLGNVFGLSREHNQSFDTKELVWSGYTSASMNLAEEQDDTYSIANCLAAAWQRRIDESTQRTLPDLYIVHIAIGAEGVTDGYMWHPDRAPKLVPGKLGTVDISLFPFSKRIFSMIADSLAERGLEADFVGLHWRGGENDVSADTTYLEENLYNIYSQIFDSFNALLGTPPTVLHKLVCPDRMNDRDPSGSQLLKMNYINTVFDELERSYDNISVFDVRHAPQYIEGVRGNGLFKQDMVHFTPEVNKWVADTILREYEKKNG